MLIIFILKSVQKLRFLSEQKYVLDTRNFIICFNVSVVPFSRRVNQHLIRGQKEKRKGKPITVTYTCTVGVYCCKCYRIILDFFPVTIEAHRDSKLCDVTVFVRVGSSYSLLYCSFASSHRLPLFPKIHHKWLTFILPVLLI